jgi:hypothetical protein
LALPWWRYSVISAFAGLAALVTVRRIGQHAAHCSGSNLR